MQDHQSSRAWLGTVGLAASALGILEGLWQTWLARPLSPTETVLVLAWASVAYTGPAILVGAVLIGINKVGKRTGEGSPGIPAGLLSLGLWVAIMTSSVLYADGFLKLVIELPASVALAIAVCLFLRHRWPRSLNSLRTWLLLHGLLLSAAALLCLVNNRHSSSGQVLAVVSIAAVAGAWSLWSFSRRLGGTKTLVGANTLAAGALVLLAVWPTGYGQVVTATGEHRNVLLITIDTLRADHLGSYGYAKGTSPSIDSMAAESVLFEEAYASSVRTSPSHASILTGLDLIQHGSHTNAMPLSSDVLTLPEILGHHGYETAAFISGWTLTHEVCGLGSRFHTYQEDFTPWRWLPQLAGQVRAIHLMKSLARRFGLQFERIERPAGETTDEVLEWLERPHGRPFFLWVHYFDPHLPYAPPPPYDQMFDPNYKGTVDGNWNALSNEAAEILVNNPADLRHMIALYDGEIAYVDAQIGRLRDALMRLGLDRNTLVILTSDHGESHGEHHRYFTRDLYRPSLHVPLILNFPKGESRPQRVSQQVRLIDVTPTVMDYLTIGSNHSVGGKSLLPLLRGGEDKEERPAFSLSLDLSTRRRTFAIRDKGYNLIRRSAWWSTGIRTAPLEELYNVKADPEENTNILGQADAVLPELRLQLKRWHERKLPGDPEPTDEQRRKLKSLGYVR